MPDKYTYFNHMKKTTQVTTDKQLCHSVHNGLFLTILIETTIPLSPSGAVETLEYILLMS